MIVIFLAYQNSWIWKISWMDTMNYIYRECCHKERKDKETISRSLEKNKKANAEMPDKQSVLAVYSSNERQKDSIIITILPDTPAVREEKS